MCVCVCVCWRGSMGGKKIEGKYSYFESHEIMNQLLNHMENNIVFTTEFYVLQFYRQYKYYRIQHNMRA